MTFSPTPEQSAILSAATGTADNLLIKALAGAAKTSTLVLIANALPKSPILCVAFNKRISDEMKLRLPSNCEAKTLNSLGHRAWADTTGKRLKLDTGKTYRLLKAAVDALDNGQKLAAYESFSELLKTIEAGKSAGYIPTGHYPNAKRLLSDDEFFETLEEEPTALEEDLIRAVSLESLREAFSGTIDFSDQILMPTVFSATFPQYPLVLIDEAQDLSALNHAMLRKFARKRLIAVGDECQAIYGFRGAHEDSMRLLREQYAMKEFPLSVSFRCPIAVVESARWRAPTMLYPDWASPGEVRHLTSWSADSIPDEAAIICRNNAPLFSTAIKLLKHGRYPELVGNDIGKVLIKWMKKLGDERMSQAQALTALAQWEAAKAAKARDPSKAADQAACMEVFIRQGKTLGDAIAYAEHILAVRGPVKLMTGHKSKGLEFPHVYFLDQHLVRNEGQDRNLRYVIQTRAQQTLNYINIEDFDDSLDKTNSM